MRMRPFVHRGSIWKRWYISPSREDAEEGIVIQKQEGYDTLAEAMNDAALYAAWEPA